MSGGPYIQEPTIETIRQIYMENDTLAPKEIWYKLQNRVEKGERIPSLSWVQKYCREELFPNYKRMLEELKETPWNTATLNSEPINAEAIPWLIALQVSRKKFLSKPITLREAKWFNRFFELRNDIVIKDSDVDNDPKLKKTVLSHIIAMWAQIYAYREKMDTIAGIKKPDYTDLDSHLVELDFEAVYTTAAVRTIREELAFTGTENHSKDDLAKFYSAMRLSSMEGIRYWEAFFLSHSLGDPDMSEESIGMYAKIILSLIGEKSFDELEKSRKKSTYQQRLAFFARLRQWCNENPETEVTTDNFLSIVSSIKKFKGEKDRVEEMMSASSIAAAAAEGFNKRFGGTVDKEESGERTKQTNPKVKDAGT